MGNLIEAVRGYRERRQQQPGLRTLEDLKAAYSQLVQREKALEAYLDDNAVPRAEREAKVEEFRGILGQLSQLLSEMARMGHQPKPEEVLNGFSARGA